MAAVRGRGNRSTELKLRMGLVRAGIEGWICNEANLPGKPDFYFPSAKLAVFVDGCFWHGCARCGHIPKTNSEFWAVKIDRNRRRHRKIATLLAKLGIRTVRFWEHQLRVDLPKCVSRIEARLLSMEPKSRSASTA
jgi:DNA mismatch endonuclease, patch repair protein